MTATESPLERWGPRGTRLTLLGTVHGDPQGFRRLHQFLDRSQPDLVLLELSPFGWAYRVVHQRLLQKTLTENLRHAAQAAHRGWQEVLGHPEILAIRRQISLPFEYRASCRYARIHNKRLRLVDSSDFSRGLVAGWPELISTANLAVLLTLPPARWKHAVVGSYRRAHALLDSASKRVDMTPAAATEGFEDFAGEREYSLAESVRRAVIEGAPANAVYVGGWEHLCDRDKPPSLRCLLGVSAQQCHLLDGLGP